MFIQADAAKLPFADDSFDLVFGSPPYCDARTYGIDAQRECQDWIDWMLGVTSEAVRVSKGLVIWICAGVTRDWCYWPGPEGLLYEWWRRGGRCWRPAYWYRVGIPGSGGKQWLRADVEYALCFSKCDAAIPWADNTANGHPPKWAPGGEMSYRLSDGTRRDEWGRQGSTGNRRPNGERIPQQCNRKGDAVGNGGRKERGQARRQAVENGLGRKIKAIDSGEYADKHTSYEWTYVPPKLANPGNLIKIKVGGGQMGHKLAHENEAPFPQALAEWFIRSWCPPGGTVLDPFSGSGTTVAAAMALGRRGVGTDIRLSQCELGRRRCGEIQTEMF
jgi:hypothetical protein